MIYFPQIYVNYFNLFTDGVVEGESVYLNRGHPVPGRVKNSRRLAEDYLVPRWPRAIQAMEVLDKWFSPKLGSKNKIVCTTRKSTAAAFGLTIDTL